MLETQPGQRRGWPWLATVLALTTVGLTLGVVEFLTR